MCLKMIQNTAIQRVGDGFLYMVSSERYPVILRFFIIKKWAVNDRVSLMRYFKLHRIVTGSWIICLFMMMTSMVVADAYVSPSLAHSSVQLVAKPANPWALPETSEKFLNFQQSTKFRKQPDRAGKYSMDRFVTPEILESLKQQQMQIQMMPRNRQDNRPIRRRLPTMPSMLPQAWSLPPEQGRYGLMGTVNPLYDTPVVSPWGSGPDIIYRGEVLPDSLSGVPNEAIGGLPPIHIPPLGDTRFDVQPFSEFGNEFSNMATGNQPLVEENVFNPFTFLPNRGMQ